MHELINYRHLGLGLMLMLDARCLMRDAWCGFHAGLSKSKQLEASGLTIVNLEIQIIGNWAKQV